MAIKLTITQERMSNVMVGNDYGLGFCIVCGAEHYECEPDAREYHCDNCNENKVYGAEELLIMGLLEIT